MPCHLWFSKAALARPACAEAQGRLKGLNGLLLPQRVERWDGCPGETQGTLKGRDVNLAIPDEVHVYFVRTFRNTLLCGSSVLMNTTFL